MNIVKKYAVKAAMAVGIFTPAIVMADTFDSAAIGQQIASVIMGFVAMVSAVGMAAITVILAIQGFKMAWSMIKSVK
ncbi:hypothetical protein [Neisseria polysaccharea]|uniref:hypothetical protein n=1 Tax=Neisseria polysaccharea TaxID=489 RepID=UPI00272A86E2|nr:hypothetical protein [Neisseria polysaccharea]